MPSASGVRSAIRKNLLVSSLYSPTNKPLFFVPRVQSLILCASSGDSIPDPTPAPYELQ